MCYVVNNYFRGGGLGLPTVYMSHEKIAGTAVLKNTGLCCGPRTKIPGSVGVVFQLSYMGGGGYWNSRQIIQ